MPTHRLFPAALILTFALSVPAVVRADQLPTQVGECSESTIAMIGGRLEGDDTFESGTAVQFDNGGSQISYDRIDAVVNSRIGDPVRICLVSIPEGCPPGDERGRVYSTTNLRSGEAWELPDSSHLCGGA